MFLWYIAPCLLASLLLTHTEGIPRETHEANLRRWQAEKEGLTAGVMKLKESEGIAQQQCLAMATISQSYEQEISLLKRQLLEFQLQTDDRLIIGMQLCVCVCTRR